MFCGVPLYALGVTKELFEKPRRMSIWKSRGKMEAAAQARCEQIPSSWKDTMPSFKASATIQPSIRMPLERETMNKEVDFEFVFASILDSRNQLKARRGQRAW